MCKEETNSDDSESKRETIVAVLKGTLGKLCSVLLLYLEMHFIRFVKCISSHLWFGVDVLSDCSSN